MKKWLLLIALAILPAQILAQTTATITWNTTFQAMDGLGAGLGVTNANNGNNNPYVCGGNGDLAGSMTSSLAGTLFGSGTGQAGLSLVRVQVCPDGTYPDNTALSTILAANPNVRIWATPWTPPVAYTVSGSPYNGANCLVASHYQDYANYLTNWIKHEVAAGLPIYALSVQNEPDFTQTGNQPVCGWGNQQFDTFISTNLGPTFASNGITTKIAIPETSNAGNMVNYASTCVGDSNCSKYLGIVTTHLYSGTLTDDTAARGIGAHEWETEIFSGQTFNGSMADALTWAQDIHNAFINNYSAWHYWMLIANFGDNEPLIELPSTTSSRLFALGNWSKFIAPGWLRMSATANPTGGVFVTAFKNPTGTQFSIVAINTNGSPQSMTFSLSGITPNSTIIPYLTSTGNNLAQQANITANGSSFNATLASSSVTTFTGTIPAAPPGNVFYVDYTHGSDTNTGTCKAAISGCTGPWQHAPGMAGTTGLAASTIMNAGAKIILRGCVTWPNAAFSWIPKGNGVAGNPVTYTVDQTWWDNTVSGCSTSWNRPIFNLGNLPPSDNLYRYIELGGVTNITLDNFEITNAVNAASPGNGSTSIFDWGSGNPTQVTVQNMYIHGWNYGALTVGTGNLNPSNCTLSGSVYTCTIPNYVPASYLPGPPPTPTCTTIGCRGAFQLEALTGGIPLGNNCPTLSAFTGTNPYTLTFVCNVAINKTVTGATIQIGGSYLNINGGAIGSCTQCIFQDNVVDGADSTAVLINPYQDCGLSEANNNLCVASATLAWRQPGVFRNNFIQFIGGAGYEVGGCTEWSGNTMQYSRNGVDPTSHTNGIECSSDFPVNNATLYYNNVFRHSTNPNASTPGGLFSIGLGWILPQINVGETAYIFNNVTYDILQNYSYERGTNTGTEYIFNNSGDCGVQWSLTYGCANGLLSTDIVENNYFVTTATNVFAAASGQTLPNTSTNLIQTPTQATAAGYTPSQTFAYSPTAATSPTVGQGVSVATICSGLSSISSAAASACLNDTVAGVGYNTSNHTVIIPNRTPLTRPTPRSIGAYEFVASSSVGFLSVNPTNSACGSVNTGSNVNCPTFNVQNTGTASISFTSTVLSDTTDYSISSNTCTGTLAVNATCTTVINFAPGSAGSLPSNLTYTTNASNSPTVVTLTGTGTTAATPTISVLPSWSIVQHKPFDHPSACNSSLSCQITIPSTSVGSDVLALSVTTYSNTGSGSAFSSVTGCGGSWVNNTGSSINHTFSGVTATNYMLYNLSPNSGCTSITITLTGTVFSWAIEEIEATSASGTVALDTGGTAFSASCTTACPGVALTLIGANDLIIQGIQDVNNTITSITGGAGYNAFTADLMPTFGAAAAAAINTITGGPPSWSDSATGSIASSAIAFNGAAPIAFGSLNSGVTSSAQTALVLNTSTVNATLNSSSAVTLSGTNAADFAITGGTCGNSVVVAPAGNCTVTITFTPSINGAESATLNIADNATGSPQTISLSGTGLGTPAAATPTFSPGSGTYSTAQVVTISTTTSGSTICYTTDNSTPAASTPGTCSHGTSLVNNGPVTISSSTLLQALATNASNTNSSVSSANYTITAQVATPVINPNGGNCIVSCTVTLSDATPGASIYYDQTIAPPTGCVLSSTTFLYTSPFAAITTGPVNAIACAPGMLQSAIATAQFTVNPGQAFAPKFNQGGNSYIGPQVVSLSSQTQGAVIYYTFNGATPACGSGTQLTNGASINIPSTGILQAIACATGYTSSVVSQGNYVINPPPAVKGVLVGP